jgi:lipopolysaccharide exporter
MAVTPFTYLRSLIPAQGSFSANVFTLMTGTTLAQGLTIAAAPVLTRLYTPEDFGIVALFGSITSIFSVVAGGRYEMAIMLPHEDKDAANVLALACIITIFISAVALVLVAGYRHSIAAFLRAPELAAWLWWAPLSILLTGLYQAFNYWNNRKKQYKYLAVSRGGQAFGTVGVQVAVGALGPGGGAGLIAGTLSGQVLGVAILSRLTNRADYSSLTQSVSLENIKRQGRFYRRFPLFDSWAGLANLGAHQLPPLFLNFFFNAATAGFFNLGYRVLNLPLTLINITLGQVFFQRYEEKRKTSGKQEFLFNTIKSLTSIAVFPTILLFLFAPFLFRTIFGQTWTIAGEYVQILIPLLFCRFIASPISTVLWSEGKNSWLLFWQISLLIANILSFSIGGLTTNVKASLLFFSISGALLYLISIVMVIKSANTRP